MGNDEDYSWTNADQDYEDSRKELESWEREQVQKRLDSDPEWVAFRSEVIRQANRFRNWLK